MKVTIRESGGVVGKQHLGPVETREIDSDDGQRIEAAVRRLDWSDSWDGEPSNTPVRTLTVSEEETDSLSWLVSDPPKGAAELVDSLEAVTNWKVS